MTTLSSKGGLWLKTALALSLGLSLWTSGTIATMVKAAPTNALVNTADNAPAKTGTSYESDLNIPCPSFWSVQPNPSVENSLSYVHESGNIAISVTYIANRSGEVSAETFARVAAEQMNCTLPVKSNLLARAWAFDCASDGIEAQVYGEPGNLVLLSISGRSDATESYLNNFISFLNYQASIR